MRALRLLPLLVLVFSASAAASDHRVDANAGVTFRKGSYLLGGRFALGVPIPPKIKDSTGHDEQPLSLVFDVAIESGTDDNTYQKRETYALGARYTLPQSGLHHKVHLLALGVLKDRVKGVEDDGGPAVLGIGWEFVPEPGNGSSHGLGLGAQLDTIVGKQSHVRLTIGLVFRLKK